MTSEEPPLSHEPEVKSEETPINDEEVYISGMASDLKLKINDVVSLRKSKNQSLKRRVKLLNQTCDGLREQLSSLTEQKLSLNNQLHDKEVEVTGLLQKIEDFRAEIQEGVSLRLAKDREISEQSISIDTLQAELETARSQLDLLQKEISLLKGLRTKNQELEIESKKFIHEIEVLRTDLQLEKDQVESLSQRLVVEKQKSSGSEEIIETEIRKRSHFFDEQIDKLTVKLDALETENDDLRERIYSINTENVDLKHHVDDKISNIRVLEGELSLTRSKIPTPRPPSISTMVMTELMHEDILEMETEQTQLKTVQYELDVALQRIRELEIIEKEHTSLRSDYNALRGDYESVLAKVDVLQVSEKRLNNENHNILKEKEKLFEETVHLQEELDLVADIKIENKELRDAVDRLKTQLFQANDESMQMENFMNEGKRALKQRVIDVESRDESIVQLEKENKGLRQKMLFEAEEFEIREDKLKKRIIKRDDEISVLNDELMHFNKKYDDTNEKLKQMVEDIGSLKPYKRKYDIQNDRMVEVRAENSELKKTNREVMAKLHDYERTKQHVKVADDRVSEMRQHVSVLERTVKKQSKEIDELATEKDIARREIDTLRSLLESTSVPVAATSSDDFEVPKGIFTQQHDVLTPILQNLSTGIIQSQVSMTQTIDLVRDQVVNVRESVAKRSTRDFVVQLKTVLFKFRELSKAHARLKSQHSDMAKRFELLKSTTLKMELLPSTSEEDILAFNQSTLQWKEDSMELADMRGKTIKRSEYDLTTSSLTAQLESTRQQLEQERKFMKESLTDLKEFYEGRINKMTDEHASQLEHQMSVKAETLMIETESLRETVAEQNKQIQFRNQFILKFKNLMPYISSLEGQLQQTNMLVARLLGLVRSVCEDGTRERVDNARIRHIRKKAHELMSAAEEIREMKVPTVIKSSTEKLMRENRELELHYANLKTFVFQVFNILEVEPDLDGSRLNDVLMVLTKLKHASMKDSIALSRIQNDMAEKMGTKLVELQSNLSMSVKQIDTLRTDRDRLKNTLHNTRKELSELQMNVEMERSDSGFTETQVRILTEQNTSLLAQTEQMRQRTKTVIDENTALLSTNSSLKTNNSVLENRLRDWDLIMSCFSMSAPIAQYRDIVKGMSNVEFNKSIIELFVQSVCAFEPDTISKLISETVLVDSTADRENISLASLTVCLCLEYARLSADYEVKSLKLKSQMESSVKINELRNRVDSVKTKNTELKATIGEQVDALYKLRSNHEQANIIISHRDLEIERLKKELGKVKKSQKMIEDMSLLIEGLQSAKNRLESEVDAKDDRLRSLENSNNGLKSKIEEMIGLLNERETDNQSLQRSLGKEKELTLILQEEKRMVVEKQGTQKTANDDLLQQIDTQRILISELESHSQELEGALSIMRSEKALLNNEKEKLEDELEAKKSELTQALSSVSDSGREISSLKMSMADMTEQLQRPVLVESGVSASVETTVNGVQCDLGDNSDAIMQESLRNYQSERVLLADKVTELQDELDRNHDTIRREVRQEFMEFSQRIEFYKSIVDSLDCFKTPHDITLIKERYIALFDKLKTTQNELDAVNSREKQMEKVIDELRTKFDNVSKKLEEAKETMRNSNDGATTLRLRKELYSVRQQYQGLFHSYRDILIDYSSLPDHMSKVEFYRRVLGRVNDQFAKL
ncbi:hypothetical protein PCE1_002524 [Barthelona sp. PCE]